MSNMQKYEISSTLSFVNIGLLFSDKLYLGAATNGEVISIILHKIKKHIILYCLTN